MTSLFTRRAGSCIAASLAGFAGLAPAQTCTPEWQGQPGTPGITSGYVAPIVEWNDGTGAALYVGGSFPNIGGVAGTALLAKFNPATNAFSKLGTGLSTGSTNGFLTALQPYSFGPPPGNRLIVGGFFASAGGQAGTKSLAQWDGTKWANCGTNFVANSANAVWSMAVWNGRLYIGGSFADCGGVIGANGVASWDGATWQGLGSGIGTGFNPNAFAMKVFNDGSGEALYIGGRFNEIGGVPGSALIGKWDGTQWSKVGEGRLRRHIQRYRDHGSLQRWFRQCALLRADGTSASPAPATPALRSGMASSGPWLGSISAAAPPASRRGMMARA
jgi:hypothetical protein